MPGKQRGKQRRDDDEAPAADSRVNAASKALRRVTVSAHDEAAAEQEAMRKLRAQQQTRELHGAEAADDEDDADSWEDVDDDDDVDERFDEMDDGEVVESSDSDDDGMADHDEEYQRLAAEKKQLKFTDADANEDEEIAAEDDEAQGRVGEVWRRDQKSLQEGEKLEYANRAYDCFFQMRSEFPCLSFDVIRDHEGTGRTKYPLSLSVAVGSQASESNANQLYLIRVRNLLRTRHDQEDEDDDDDEDVFGDADSSDDGNGDSDEEAEEVNGGEPLISFQTIRHHGAVNRIRSNPLQPSMLATWSDAGIVQVFDAAPEVSIIAEFSNAVREQNVSAEALAKKSQPLKFASSPSNSHRNEGYGLDWSRVAANHFASGDIDGRIFVWAPAQGGRWAPVASTQPSARRMVEEIQWSPMQPTVLIAGRAGGDVEVWDTRDMKKSKICWKADHSDINVASWNPTTNASHLIATGAESGMVAVWDLRSVAKGAGAKPAPIQSLNFHNGAAVSALEFSEHNESVLGVTTEDGQCTLWDLSVERDADEEREVLGQLFGRQDTSRLPDQLMFQHQGLAHPKEVHFHPQIPGFVLTGDFNGLHLFKPRNWRSLMK